MAGYLIDTNVISAGAPAKQAPAELLAWMDAQSVQLWLSAVTVAEIEDGIAKLRRDGAGRECEALTAWLEAVLHLYGERILPFDAATARIAGALSDRARGQGLAPGFADIILAATARRHGLVVLTRNLKDFAPLGVAALDPFVTPPPG
jgi:predicted nucleic acid-binding protein